MRAVRGDRGDLADVKLALYPNTRMLSDIAPPLPHRPRESLVAAAAQSTGYCIPWAMDPVTMLEGVLITDGRGGRQLGVTDAQCRQPDIRCRVMRSVCVLVLSARARSAPQGRGDTFTSSRRDARKRDGRPRQREAITSIPSLAPAACVSLTFDPAHDGRGGAGRERRRRACRYGRAHLTEVWLPPDTCAGRRGDGRLPDKRPHA